MADKEPLLIFGAGGHAKSVIDAAQCEGRYGIVGLVDSYRESGSEFFGHRILGGEDDLPQIVAVTGCKQIYVAIGDNYQRYDVSKRLKELVPDICLATIVHPSAIISTTATIGDGVVVMAGAVINADSHIGDGCLVNTRAGIDHDCVLEPFSSVAPGVSMGGHVTIGKRSSVGVGTSLNHRITIGRDVVVGSGSAVVYDIPDCVVAIGAPCRVKRLRPIDERYL